MLEKLYSQVIPCTSERDKLMTITFNGDIPRHSDNNIALYRKTMGCLAGGVSVILSGAASAPTGMTINSLTSVSLDPLLLLFCARLQSATAKTAVETGLFSVNILAHKQLIAALYFSGCCNVRPIFAIDSQNGYIWIKDTVGSFLCSVESTHRAGDHDIIVGRVQDIIDNPDRPSPLIYHEGQYRSLEPVCTAPKHERTPMLSSLLNHRT